MNENRAKLLLAALLIGLLIVGRPYLSSFFQQVGVGGSGSGSGLDLDRHGDLVLLDTARLENAPGSYSPGRNLFRYEPEKASPPPPTPPPPPPKPVDDGRPPPPPPPPPPPKPPSFTLSLFGILGPEARRIAVFKEGKDVIVSALEDEVLQEKFIVHRIGYQTVDIKFVGFPDVEPHQVKLDRDRN